MTPSTSVRPGLEPTGQTPSANSLNYISSVNLIHFPLKKMYETNILLYPVNSNRYCIGNRPKYIKSMKKIWISIVSSIWNHSFCTVCLHSKEIANISFYSRRKGDQEVVVTKSMHSANLDYWYQVYEKQNHMGSKQNHSCFRFVLFDFGSWVVTPFTW